MMTNKINFLFLFWLILFCTYSFIFINLSKCVSQSPLSLNADVKIGLEANWASTSPIDEAAEFFYGFNSSLYFNFLQYLHKQDISKLDDHQDQLKTVFDFVRERSDLSSSLIDLLHLSLRLREYSPKLQAQNQFASQVLSLVGKKNVVEDPDNSLETFVLVRGHFVSDQESLLATLKGPENPLHQKSLLEPATRMGHVSPIENELKKNSNDSFILLFGHFTSPKFHLFYRIIQDYLKSNSHTRYIVFYYRSSSSLFSPLPLVGYGAELVSKDPDSLNKDHPFFDSVLANVSRLSFNNHKVKHFSLDNLLNAFRDRKDPADFIKEEDEEENWIVEFNKLRHEVSPIFHEDQRPLKAFEIGMRIIDRTLSSTDCFETLLAMCHNLPSFLPLIKKLPLSLITARSIADLSQHLNSPTPDQSNFIVCNNAVMMDWSSNGASIFRLSEFFKVWLGHFHYLWQHGFSFSSARQLLSSQASVGLNSSTQAGANNFANKEADVFDMRSKAVTFINNIETDNRFYYSPVSFKEYLSSGREQTEMIPTIRRNLVTLVVMMDPSYRNHLFIVRQIFSLLGFQIQSSIRIGLVLYDSDSAMNRLREHQDRGSMIATKAFYYLDRIRGAKMAMSFLDSLFIGVSDSESNRIDEKVVRNVLSRLSISSDLIDQWSKTSDHLGDDSLEDEISSYNFSFSLFRRFGAGSKESPIFFLNGHVIEMNNRILASIISLYTRLFKWYKEEYISGRLKDSNEKNMSPDYYYDYYLNCHRAFSSRHPLIVNDKRKCRFLPVASLEKNEGHLVSFRLKVIETEKDSPLMSLWIPFDISESMRSTTYLRDVLKYINSSSSEAFPKPIIYLLLFGSCDAVEKGQTWDLLHRLYNDRASVDERIEMLNSFLVQSNEIKSSVKIETKKNICNLVDGHSSIIQSLPDMDLTTDMFIIVNGRIVVLSNLESSLEASDVGDLVEYEYRARLQPLMHLLSQDVLTAPVHAETLSPIVKAVSVTNSLIGRFSFGIFSDFIQPILEDKANSGRNFLNSLPNINKWSFTVGQSDPEKVLFNFDIAIDPLSDSAPRILSWIKGLLHYECISFKLVLYTLLERETLSLNAYRYYRYVLPQSPLSAQYPRSALFTHLPSNHILTTGLDLPSSWLVLPRWSSFDLDNLVIQDLEKASHLTGRSPQNFEVFYRLQNIVIEGHCYKENGVPPRGLQLVLTLPFEKSVRINQSSWNNNDPVKVVDDTIVMANLGYFQMKANPGIFQLGLKEGRSKNIFNIISDSLFFLDSFNGILSFTTVRPTPGNEDQPAIIGDFLHKNMDEEKKESSMWSSFMSAITSPFTKKEGSSKEDSEHKIKPSSCGADINVFSIASGFVYERFIRIMMKSVLDHTKYKVKFWLLANHLSPSFIESVGPLSEALGFEYELVTYKWPSWLRLPAEKRKLVWAYKILFLDVLFPLDLDRIIFVDADQVSRTDLIELVKMDIKGAPYAFTPFCDSKPDMDNLTFWKSGYWKEQLNGRPYHISALYLVDLVKFRQSAVGDLIRSDYQGLSWDPNNLSNLDQDLPNNLQNTVPIFSLPQEWLWCDTWCDSGSFSKAKMIDLCSNPVTKEPKLASARRIIPGWDAYDQFITNILQKYELYKNLSSDNPHIEPWRQWFSKHQSDDSSTIFQFKDHVDL